jgi:hypothetical protein
VKERVKLALTTSDEIQKQLSVVFGFNGQLELEVGYIQGIGKLSKKHSEALISQTLQFLHAYNAMLRDYAGCQLHSIEFELENIDIIDANLKIMPKSMLFIPGEYKDCNTLMLLLSPEMSLLDDQKAKNSINNLGKLYYEVEEALNRPELEKEHKKGILELFAERFALKLQGIVIDGKWNRKLVGISNSSEDSLLREYLGVHMKKGISWDRMKELIPKSPKFTMPRLSLKDEDQFDFMKHRLLNSSAYVIAQNTFHLTSNLLNIANTGTVDDTQNQIFIIFINSLFEHSNETHSSPLMDYNRFKKTLFDYISIFKEYLNDYRQFTEEFCKSGEVQELSILINSCLDQFPTDDSVQNKTIHNLGKITRTQLESGKYKKKEKVRSSEFKNPIVYIEESAKIVLKAMKRSIPRYFHHIVLMDYSQSLISLLLDDFKTQQKPVMALGIKYLEKFAEFLKNKIDHICFFDQKLRDKDQYEIFKEFKHIVKDLIEPFIGEIQIGIEDLMGFVDIMMADIPEVYSHIQLLTNFTKEINLLWGLILRSSSLNRFIKEYPGGSILDPNQFSVHFNEFLRKRLGGFQLGWKSHVFKWIQDFGIEFQPLFMADAVKKKKWPRFKVINEFILYFEKKVEEESSLEGFKVPLKAYVDKHAMNINNRVVSEIYTSYNMSLDIIGQVPDYIRQIFLKSVESLQNKTKPQSLDSFLGSIPSIDNILESNAGMIIESEITQLNKPSGLKTDNQEKLVGVFSKLSFYEFILNADMKYFSHLLAKPKKIILNALDKESFQGKTLYHQIDFKYWEKFMKMYLSSNYLEVKPRFN